MVFTEDHVRSLGQQHLFDGLDAGGIGRLVEQLSALDKQYPGGLAQYIANAKKLLLESKDGVNPYGTGKEIVLF